MYIADYCQVELEMYQKHIEMLFVRHTLYIKTCQKVYYPREIGCGKIIVKQFQLYICTSIWYTHNRFFYFSVFCVFETVVPDSFGSLYACWNVL